MHKHRRGLRIGAVADAAGVNVQTLHYYERRGLVVPLGRTRNGYREYAHDAPAKVRAIKRAQGLGFTLNEIAAFDAERMSRRQAFDLQALASRKLAEIDSQIQDLCRLRKSLGALVETCPCGNDPSACRVFEELGE